MQWEEDTQVDLVIRFVENARMACLTCVVSDVDDAPPSTKRITQPWWSEDEGGER